MKAWATAQPTGKSGCLCCRRRNDGAELAALRSLLGDRHYPIPVTFAARSPAHLADNAEWQAVLDAGPATQAAIQATEVDEPVKIWLGEPVAIKPPTSALLERYEGSNLLIVGSDEQQAYGLLLAAVYSLAAQRSPQQARFVIADFSRPSTRFFGVFGRLDLPHGLDVLTARQLRVQPPASPFPPAGAAGPETRPRRSLLAAAPPVGGSLSSQPEPSLPTTPPSPLQALEALIEARWVALESGQPLADDQDVYLILAGMHGWRDLRPVDYKPAPAAEQVLRIVERGPEVGVHVIAWADGYVTLDQALKRAGIGLFDLPRLSAPGGRGQQPVVGQPGRRTLGRQPCFFPSRSLGHGPNRKVQTLCAARRGGCGDVDRRRTPQVGSQVDHDARQEDARWVASCPECCAARLRTGPDRASANAAPGASHAG